jgi:tagaturonate reductase
MLYLIGVVVVGARIEQLNQSTDFNGAITLIRRTEPVGKPDLNDQQALYSLVTRGIDGQGAESESSQMIHCVTRLVATNTAYDQYLATAEDPDYRFVFSQTTEAGIEYDDKCMATDRPPRTFPSKHTQWLYQRFSHFDGNQAKVSLSFHANWSIPMDCY